MKKPLLLRHAVLVLISSTLSGCCVYPVNDGRYRDGGYYERDRGGPHGERHEGPPPDSYDRR